MTNAAPTYNSTLHALKGVTANWRGYRSGCLAEGANVLFCET